MSNKTKALTVLKNGIFNENPTFRLVLGMCPTLAVSSAAFNGIGMGLAATFVLIGSNVVISLLRNFIPAKIRIPAFVVIIATFVTAVQLLLQAYVPDLYKSLGIFIPLIVVNCIILGRAEAFASKNSVWSSFMDGLGMGLGFTLALLIIATIREVFGDLSFFGMHIFGKNLDGALILVQPSGAFITLGLLLALINFVSKKRQQKKGAR